MDIISCTSWENQKGLPHSIRDIPLVTAYDSRWKKWWSIILGSEQMINDTIKKNAHRICPR